MSSRATSPSRVEYNTCRLSSHAHIVLIPEVVWVMIMPWYSGWHALRASKHPIMPFSLPQYTVVDAYDSKKRGMPQRHTPTSSWGSQILEPPRVATAPRAHSRSRLQLTHPPQSYSSLPA